MAELVPALVPDGAGAEPNAPPAGDSAESPAAREVDDAGVIESLTDIGDPDAELRAEEVSAEKLATAIRGINRKC
jgi:hypothetical protein